MSSHVLLQYRIVYSKYTGVEWSSIEHGSAGVVRKYVQIYYV